MRQKSFNKAQPAKQFALRPIAGACALMMLAATGQVFAQQTETVVVTGIRKGIEDAISVKKNSDSIVEAVSAEDIGKLPDVTVAESISRLPGITAQRDKSTGKAAAVSVRGMSPDFNGGLFNGREQASTSGSRGVYLDQFPAELMSQVVVYKTPDAALVGQGLSSTIDIRTIRPLDNAGRNVSIGYRQVSTANGAGEGTSKGKGNRISLAYVDQFADRTVGLALGFTRLDEKGGEQQKFNSWGGWTPESVVGKDAAGKDIMAKTIGGFTADNERLDQKRDGAMAVLQFKPNKNFETTFDVLYSKGETSLKKTGLEGAIWGGAGPYDPDGQLSNFKVANGVITDGTFNNYKGVVRNHLESADDKLTAIGLNNKFRFGEWQATVDLAQSKVKKVSSRYETTAGLPGDGNKGGKTDTISYTGFNGSNFDQVRYTTGLSYADRSVVRLTDVDGWSGGASSPQAGYFAQPIIDDKIDSGRASLGTNLNYGPIARAEIGLNFADRTKSRQTSEGRLVIKGGDPYGAVAVPGTATATAGVTGLQVVSWDPRGSLGSIYDLVQKVDADIFNKSWNVNEKATTFYAKADLDGNMGGLPFRGNFGAQVVGTKQSSSALNVNSATCTGNTVAACPSTTVSGGKSYTDVLPSLNLAFETGKDQVVRFGAGLTMARAGMDDMRASKTFSYEANTVYVDANGNKKTGIYAGSGGNPELEPYRAKAIDLSFEQYFGKKGYVSVAGFYKSLDSYILSLGKSYDFKPLIGSAAIQGTQNGVGILTAPVNGQGGTIKGFELSVNVPLFAGFGIMANHSDTNSSINLASVGLKTQDVGLDKVPLPGLSKRVTNARLYFENHGLQIAVAARQRSSFLGQISDYQDNAQYTFIKGETTVDLQAGYNFDFGYLKGLSIGLQGSNMTNAKFQRYNGKDGTVVETIKYGKTYTLGLGYKF